MYKVLINHKHENRIEPGRVLIMSESLMIARKYAAQSSHYEYGATVLHAEKDLYDAGNGWQTREECTEWLNSLTEDDWRDAHQ
jgi:hypothetical protein